MRNHQLPSWIYRLIGKTARVAGRIGLSLNKGKRRIVMADNEASEALVAKPLPEMIKNLGLAVAEANKALVAANAENPSALVVHSAEIDLNIAVTVDKSKDFSADGGLALKAFSVNASYARSYNFKEEASSRIKLSLSAKPFDQ
jgi:hypothetical protein